ncbi:hypothetical protein VKT23_003881 [Stygiomarasmius scandens]|uniref:mRNA stability protein n=1 Tax=Marasmiellus scandens TaxID=2682957 RepID=A0ABR1JYM5_9AGAR
MLPAQRNKVDISKLNEQEQLLFAKYGKLPTHKNTLMKMQKDRKYFDSGDYALSKAGVAPQSNVGTAIPNPENIPHASSPSNGHQSLSISPTNNSSPVKELDASKEKTQDQDQDPAVSPSSPLAESESLEPGVTV